MPEQGFKRKLAAILSADVEGYSRLMGDDEEATVRTLTVYREVLSTLIQQHNGKVLDSPGDNLLAEFVSVVDAVQCAVAVQKEIKARNDELLENRRMQFRIGINLGDVIEEDDRIYGDGVNIASRLESLAEPGGICISKTAFDHIESKLPLGYEYLGEQAVKNILKPVEAYRVLMETRVTLPGKPRRERASGFRRIPILTGVAAVVLSAVMIGIWQLYQISSKDDSSSVEKAGSSLPEQPSIAVLPFVNMSNDPEQEYLCDGMADQIINSIAKLPYITVIARNSSFAYKGKSINIQQIADDLGVRYILEGSLQRDKENVRINTQLIDADTGRHLWAEHYDRKLDDIFSVQDEICKSIMLALQVKLTMGEQALMGADTGNIRAYEKFLKGREHQLRRTWEEALIARQLFQEAVTLDPEYAQAYVEIGWTCLDDIWLGMTKTPSESIAKAEEMLQKAISIHGHTAGVYALLSAVNLLKKDWVKAIACGQKAVELSPNRAGVHTLLGYALRSNGQYEEAISSYKKALQLNPVKNINRLDGLAFAYLFSKQYEKAISIWNDVLERNPDYIYAYVGLTMAYWLTGSEVQARQTALQLLRLKPNFSVSYVEKRSALRDKKLKEQLFNALRKAGLK